MAAPDIYNQVFIEANGLLLSENTTITTSLTSDDQDVLTTIKGWALRSRSRRRIQPISSKSPE